MAPSLRVERALLRERCTRLACVDEVGRGALAGPVTVGVVLIEHTTPPAPQGVCDSKLATPAQRARLAPLIEQWCAAFAVAHASNAEIDELGIIAALRLAGRRALAKLDQGPDLVLLDGSHDWLSSPAATLFDDPQPHAGSQVEPLAVAPAVVTRVKADLECAGVAAASILAKVARDALMAQAAITHPDFGWDRNKGYASAEHRQALRSLGPTPLHRVSWRLDAPSTGP